MSESIKPLPENIRILSFDPGLSALGWSFGIYQRKSGIFHVQKYGDVHGSKIAAKNKAMVELYGQRLITLDVIEKAVFELIETYKPDEVGSEAAFYHPQRPNAYMALLLCIHTIERLLFYTYQKKLYTFPPRTVKLTASGTGTSGKEEIQDALLRHPNIVFKQSKTNPLEKMTQHSGDAIAVGYTTALHLCMNAQTTA